MVPINNTIFCQTNLRHWIRSRTYFLFKNIFMIRRFQIEEKSINCAGNNPDCTHFSSRIFLSKEVIPKCTKTLHRFLTICFLYNKKSCTKNKYNFVWTICPRISEHQKCTKTLHRFLSICFLYNKKSCTKNKYNFVWTICPRISEH